MEQLIMLSFNFYFWHCLKFHSQISNVCNVVTCCSLLEWQLCSWAVAKTLFYVCLNRSGAYNFFAWPCTLLEPQLCILHVLIFLMTLCLCCWEGWVAIKDDIHPCHCPELLQKAAFPACQLLFGKSKSIPAVHLISLLPSPFHWHIAKITYDLNEHWAYDSVLWLAPAESHASLGHSTKPVVLCGSHIKIKVKAACCQWFPQHPRKTALTSCLSRQLLLAIRWSELQNWGTRFF